MNFFAQLGINLLLGYYAVLARRRDFEIPGGKFFAHFLCLLLVSFVSLGDLICPAELRKERIHLSRIGIDVFMDFVVDLVRMSP